MAAPPYGPGGPGYAAPPIMAPPAPAVSNPLLSGAQTPAWANPLLYGGLALLGQGPSLTPQNPFGALAGGLGMGMQANALQAEQARQNEELKMRREEMAAKREERERLAAGREQAADILGQMRGAREMAGPLQPGQARPIVEGLTPSEGALELMAVPGYEAIGAQMFGQQQTREYRDAVLAETQRANLADEDQARRDAAIKSEIAAIKAAADQAKAGTLKGKDAYEIARKEMAAFPPQRDALLRIKSFLENPGPLSDVSAITAYAKILDPTSVVRQSETAALESAQGLVDRIISIANRWSGEGALPPGLRQEMIDRVNDLSAIYATEYAEKRKDTAAILSEGNIARPEVYMGREASFPETTMPPGLARSTAPQAAGPEGKPPGMPQAEWDRFQELRAKQGG